MYAQITTTLKDFANWVADPSNPVTWILVILLALISTSLLGPRIGWAIRWPFFFLNKIQWLLYNPLRWLFRTGEGKWTHGLFLALLWSFVIPIYWLTIHVLFTPVRFINAVYFNMLLFWTLTLSDGLKEIFNPKLGRLREMRGLRYLGYWVKGFPMRIGHFLRRNTLMFLEGIVMTGFDTLWPTMTMWHGTSFEGTATDIAQKGRWYVGNRNHVGSGIYFGIERRVAEHYSKSTETTTEALVVSRVTLSFCRTTWMLPQPLRSLIGSRGEQLSSSLKWPWRATEHWRGGRGMNWFEYCLIQSDSRGEYVKVWRARPIAVLKGGKVSRIWGGFSLLTGNVAGTIAILVTWTFSGWLYWYFDQISSCTIALVSQLQW